MVDVARYYDRATKRFLAQGHGGDEYAIHRAVWGPGVSSRSEAIHYVHELILELIEREECGRVVDLGCGVGGSLRYLFDRFKAEYWGLTISSTQKKISTEVVGADPQGPQVLLGDMVRVLELLPPQVARGSTLFFAIESIVHLSDPFELFRGLQDASPGDHVVIVDDVLDRPPLASEARLLARFMRGWRVPGFGTLERIIDCAQRTGFTLVETSDLTDYLELRRPRDRLAKAFLPVLKVLAHGSEWASSLVGGDALQSGLGSGLIAYRYSVFRRS